MDIALGLLKLIVALGPALVLQVLDYRRFRQEVESDPRPDWLKERSWIGSRSRQPRNPPPLVVLILLAWFVLVVVLPFP